MTIWTVLVVRIGLSRREFSTTREQLLAGLVAGAERDDSTARRIFRGVRLVSRFVPGATCLTQALAAQVLLARHSMDSDIVLGVRHDARGRLRAHAWLYYGGRIALGGPPAAASGFARLGSFGANGP